MNLFVTVCGVVALGALGVPSGLRAQNGAVPSVIMGHVTDTLDHPLKGATVEIVGLSKGLSKATVVTETDGSFIVPSVTPGGPYAIAARMLGYAPVSVTRESMKSGDTLRIALRLVYAPPSLENVQVEGAKGSAQARKMIRAEDFNPKHNYDALMVLSRYRPGMLGDADRCPPMPGRKSLDKIYVNGVRRDAPGFSIPNPFRPSVLPRSASVTESVLQVLERIPAGDIQEIHFADCWDKDLPIDRQNALYVTLKPGKKYR